jgi:hypothetical protein
MKIDRTAMVVCLAALCAPFSYASSPLNVNGSGAAATDPVRASSSSVLPDAPDAALNEVVRPSKGGSNYGPNTRLELRTRPFSSFAIGLSGGAGGVGVQVATPLATKINLRGGFSFLNYNPTIVEDGIPIDGAIKFRSVFAGVDLYPFHNTFHITPGFTLFNGNKAVATTNIPGGSNFEINDTNYWSDAADPVHGSFDVSFGHRYAPSLTVGFGNMLRRESHWSIPVDFGFQYIGTPKFTLQMQGSVCDPADGCTTIASDQDTQTNLAQEQVDINKDIAPLRFYPILTIGVAYRFGHNVKMSLWR